MYQAGKTTSSIDTKTSSNNERYLRYQDAGTWILRNLLKNDNI